MLVCVDSLVAGRPVGITRITNALLANIAELSCYLWKLLSQPVAKLSCSVSPLVVGFLITIRERFMRHHEENVIRIILVQANGKVKLVAHLN